MLRFRSSIAALTFIAVSALSMTARADWKKGDALEVSWKSKWYKAALLEVKDGKYKIHYDGFESSWDEAVGPDRARPVGGWKNGDALEVEWKGKWYKAKILDVKDGKYKVHYDGFESSWDEPVTEARMRKA
jgi:hypothetical protein